MEKIVRGHFTRRPNMAEEVLASSFLMQLEQVCQDCAVLSSQPHPPMCA